MHERSDADLAAKAVHRVLCQPFNWTLEHGIFPSTFNSTYIMPILKKADFDAADVRSYWPISDLSVLSKLLERLVCSQLLQYLKDNGLLPDLQLAYRVHYSTETALVKVLSPTRATWRCCHFSTCRLHLTIIIISVSYTHLTLPTNREV